MAATTDLDRRRPRASNDVFEAHDQHDDTKHYHFHAFRDESDTGVYLNFVNPDDRRGSGTIRDWMWIDSSQCREFGKALLAAADLAHGKQG